VWAVALRITDVPTLRAMKDLFRRCYKTRLKALSELFDEGLQLFEPGVVTYDEHGKERPAPELESKTRKLKERLNQLGLFQLEDFQAYLRETESERRSADRCREWSKDHFNFTKVSAHELEHVNPELFDITHTIDFDGWFHSNKLSMHDVSLKDIGKSYVWAIEKRHDDSSGDGETGATYLFTKLFADSVERAALLHPEQCHAYPKQQTGSYTARKKLFPKDGQLIVPPRRTLTRIVDAVNIELMLAVFAKPGSGSLSREELQENLAHLHRVQESAEDQAAACAQCSSLMLDLKALGPISRKDTQTPAEKAAMDEKQRAKSKLLDAHRRHMLDADFREQHSSLVLTRFWGAWIDRRLAISSSLLARSAEGRISQLRLMTKSTPYHRHPPTLCSDKWEPSIFPALDRVDVRCLQVSGAPQVGHYAVVRSKDANDAFFLGKITALHPDARQEHERVQQRLDSRLTLAYRQHGPGIIRMPTPAMDARLLHLSEVDEQLLATMQQVRLSRHQRTHGSNTALPPPPVEIRASSHAASPVGQPSSLGLFATRDIKAREFIDFYSVFVTPKIVYQNDRSMRRTHVCALPGSDMVLDGLPMANALTRYIADSPGAQARVQLLPASAFHPAAMYAHVALSHPSVAGALACFNELPKGCLLNSPGQSRHLANCERKHHRKDFDALFVGCKMPYVRATRDIRRGEELLGLYNNEEEKTAWRCHQSQPAFSSSTEEVRGHALGVASLEVRQSSGSKLTVRCL
jgi:hypothetical protein